MRLNVKEACAVLEAEVFADTQLLEHVVTGAYSSDLLSDVMANAREGNIWLTIQTHPNIIAVASIANLSAVAITGGKKPDEETLNKAKEEKVVILTTRYNSFEAAGRLYGQLTAGN